MRRGSFWMWVLGLGLVLALAPLSQGLAAETKQETAPAPAEKQAAPAASEQKQAAPAMEQKTEGAAEQPKEATAEKKEQAKEKPAGMVGTVVAVVPDSGTLVVDVPQGKAVLRIGAWATKKTKIEAGGKSIAFSALKVDSKVRINIHRTSTGDDLISVEVLSGRKG